MPINDEHYVLVKNSDMAFHHSLLATPASQRKEEKKDESKAYAPPSLSLTSYPSVKGKGKRTGVREPPSFNSTICCRFKRQFHNVTSSTTVYSISGNNLAGALGATVFTANTSARAQFSTAKIHALRVWTPAAGLGVDVTADCRWSVGATPTFIKDEDWIKARPDGITSAQNGLIFTPPPGTLCGEWMIMGQVGAGVLFILELYQGCIVELDIEATLANNQTGATVSISAGTVGVQGFTALNGAGGGLAQLGCASVLT